MENMTRNSEASTLPGHEILRWIEDGFREYGPDPWLLIRELAQNSRDAGASAIQIRTGLDSEGREFLVFEDNGSGMSLKTARKHLFRFYSSSKERTRGAAGRFGIGFWSVWRFHPRMLLIQSRHHHQAWSLKVDSGFTVTLQPSPELKKGTRIVLIRDPRFPDLHRFSHEVRKAARKYCAWLQRIPPFRGPLPVYFNGESITLPLKPPGAPVMLFRGSGLRGAAALGESPEVRLFSGGLPVWKGTSLEELGNGNHRPKSRPISGNGLYPVVWMDITDLRIDLSRRHALFDSRLAAYRRKGERALSGLFNQVLDSSGSRGWNNRIRDWIAAAALRLRGRIWLQVAILLAFLIPVEIFILDTFNTEIKPVEGQSLLVDSFQYDGAGVSANNPDLPVPDLTYSPPGRHYFRLFTASEYHSERGFVQSRRQPAPVSKSPDGPTILSVNIRTSGGTILGLPHPAGGEIDPRSIRWNGISPPALLYRLDGGYRMLLPPGQGNLTYRCLFLRQDRSLTSRESEFYRRLPADTSLPVRIRSALNLADSTSIQSKTEVIRTIVGNFLVPESGSRTARQFRNSRKKNWLARVLEIGRGDCDVINGFAVFLFRRTGIPSRLGVGWIADRGRLVPRLHAWAEFFDGRWRIMDLATSLGIPGITGNSPPKPVRPETPLPVMLTLLTAVGLIFLIILRSRRTHEKGKQTGHPRTQRGKDRLLSRMALGAMLFPHQWGMRNRLWTSGVLPLLNGRKLSLHRALKRGRVGGLYFASAGNPLARHGRHMILDGDRSHFSQIYRLIHGIIDLDRIHALQLTPLEMRPPDPMLQHLSGLGFELGKMGFTIAQPAPEHETPPTWMDLTGLNISAPRHWRRPVLIISPTHQEYLALSRIYPNSPNNALYRLVRNALSRAPIMTRGADEILADLSRNLLGGGH